MAIAPSLFLRGRRWPSLPPLMMSVFFAAALGFGFGGMAIIFVVVFLLPDIFSRLSSLLRPPTIEVRDGVFTLSNYGRELRCPAGAVEDVWLEGDALRLVFRVSDGNFGVEGGGEEGPDTGALARLDVAGGFFTAHDVRSLRDALELGERTAPPTPTMAFAQTLKKLTPHTFLTPAIIIANVAVFVVMAADGVGLFSPRIDDLIRWGADYPPRTLAGEWWRLLTAAFIHIGVAHLLVNMWVLWIAGRLVERLLGNAAFLVVYLLAALGGSLVSDFWDPVARVQAGASGAVFGVFGALMGFVLPLRGSIPSETIERVRNGGIMFLIINVIFGLSVPGIALAAHLGGFVVGLLCGWALSQPLTAEMTRRPWGRTLVVATAGAAAVFLAIRWAPPPPSDVFAAFHALDAVESKALKLNNALAERGRNGEITRWEYADIVERDILAPWREARRRIEGLQGVPDGMAEGLVKIKSYLALRQQAWELLVQYLRTNDQQAKQESEKKWQAAEALATKQE